MRHRAVLVLFLVTIPLAACATLARDLIQAPRFEAAPDRGAALRLLAPSGDQPLGGAALRLWARIENPNPFGFTLTRLDGTVLLEGERGATMSLPLGLPLAAAADTVIPLDFAISLADIPGLVDVAVRAATGRPVGYQLDGTVGVDAGAFGQPTFGPTTLLRGEAAVVR